MIGKDQKINIIDFGLSINYGYSNDLMIAKDFRGTLPYVSPEMIMFKY